MRRSEDSGSKGKPARTASSGLLNMVVFVVLVFQTTATVLMIKYCRMQSTNKSDGSPAFATTSAVALSEFFKMWVGVFVVAWDVVFVKRVHSPVQTFLNEVVGRDIRDFLKMAVPATVYALQNNLLFLALSNLDSAIYQVVYQLKTFTSALFAMAILSRRYSALQWLSFAMLATGAILANLSVVKNDSDAIDSKSDANSQENATSGNMTFGLFCVLSATLTSGFAGVFIERELKGSASLWAKNIQLGLFGCLATVINSYLFGDWDAVIATHGFLHGFDWTVWAVVALNTFGGYLVAMLLKYASNQAKAFAAGLAIVLVVAGSKVFFGSQLTAMFFLGLALVLAANVIYNRESQKQ